MMKDEWRTDVGRTEPGEARQSLHARRRISTIAGQTSRTSRPDLHLLHPSSLILHPFPPSRLHRFVEAEQVDLEIAEPLATVPDLHALGKLPAVDRAVVEQPH